MIALARSWNLRRLIDLTTAAHRKHHYVKLTASAHADIYAWLEFLTHFNGISIFLHDQFTPSESIKIYSDASGSMTIGFAAVFGSRWFAGEWDDAWQQVHITSKELFPIVLALEMWGHLLPSHKILFLTDNAAVLEIVNKQTSGDSHAMPLWCAVWCALFFNVLFHAAHIPGFTKMSLPIAFRVFDCLGSTRHPARFRLTRPLFTTSHRCLANSVFSRTILARCLPAKFSKVCSLPSLSFAFRLELPDSGGCSFVVHCLSACLWLLGCIYSDIHRRFILL